ARDRGQRVPGVRLTAVVGRETLRETLKTRIRIRGMRAHLRRGPTRIAIRMAAITGVRNAERHAPIGPRNANAVIVPRIDLHVRGVRHMTRHAARADTAGLMEMMCRRVVLRRAVTLSTHAVSRDRKS